MRDDEFNPGIFVVIITLIILGFGLFFNNMQHKEDASMINFINDSSKYSIEIINYDGDEVVKIESFKEVLGSEKYQMIQNAIDSTDGNFAEFSYNNDNYSFELFKINNVYYTKTYSFWPLYMKELSDYVHDDSNILLLLEEDDFNEIYKYEANIMYYELFSTLSFWLIATIIIIIIVLSILFFMFERF